MITPTKEKKVLKVSAVVLMYNRWDLTHQLLFDLFNYSKGIDEVVVVDNGSTESTGIEWWTGATMLPITPIRVEQNMGFLMGANLGMKSAKGDHLILLSNDVRIRGPLSSIVRATLGMFPKTLLGGRVYQSDTGWNTFVGRTFPYAEGWLLACTKDAWNEFGGFDERYAPNDFEDVDLSTTAISKGYKLQQLPDGLCEHIGAQTIGYNPHRYSLTERNQKLFREKWNI